MSRSYTLNKIIHGEAAVAKKATADKFVITFLQEIYKKENTYSTSTRLQF